MSTLSRHRARGRVRRRRSGFTLMELLLVIAILITLGGVAVVGVTGIMKGADEDSAQIQVNELARGAELFENQCKRPPSSLDDLYQDPGSLPSNIKWRGPYIKGTLGPDPWGNPYQADFQAVPFRIWSNGPDGQSGTADDIDNNKG